MIMCRYFQSGLSPLKQLHCMENTYIVGATSLSQPLYNEFQQDEKQVHSFTPILHFDPFTSF